MVYLNNMCNNQHLQKISMINGVQIVNNCVQPNISNMPQKTTSLQSGQNAIGRRSQRILVKTKSGQYQIRTIEIPPVTPPNIKSSQNQPIRLKNKPNRTPVQKILHQPWKDEKTVNSPQIQQLLPKSIQTTIVAKNSVKNLTVQEKCRNLLVNLLELSKKSENRIAMMVHALMQELINAEIDAEVFYDRLVFLINASPQPSLVGFLKKSLPLLRQSLITKELVIDGIRPPPHRSIFPDAIVTNIHTQFQLDQPTDTIDQVRMVPQQQQQLLPIPVQQIQASSIATIAQQDLKIQSHQLKPSFSRPFINNTETLPHIPAGLQICQVASIQQQPHQKQPIQHQLSITVGRKKVVKPIKVDFPTQIKKISTKTNNVIPIKNTLPPVSSNTRMLPSAQPLQQQKCNQTILSIGRPIETLSKNKAPNNNVKSLKTLPLPKQPILLPSNSAVIKAASTSKSTLSIGSFTPHIDVDDINDVASICDVNLVEESQRILDSNNIIGTKIRSCKDHHNFLNMPALQSKIQQIISKHGLSEVNADVATLISLAAQQRLKIILEKLSVIAEHRTDVIRMDPRYEVTKDVRGQIRFLAELDRAAEKRHKAEEREKLMFVAKSRSKFVDAEQTLLKERAKEMQRIELQELRQRDANLTALSAIGPRKKPRLDVDAAKTSRTGETGPSKIGTPLAPLRPRIKRVYLKDMIFYLEQERETRRSIMLCKAYLK